MKSLLLLGAGIYYVRAIEEVKAAGYRTVVVDRDPGAPGLAIADAPHAIDLSDPDAVLTVAASEHVDAVLPLNDFGVRSAARVADALGLRGLTPRTAELACDKGLMRERWRLDGLSQPCFRVTTTHADVLRAALELAMPLVLKPADSGGGGRGVSVVRDSSELDWAFKFAAAHARNGRIVVEEFLDGTEMTIEAIAAGGEVHILAVSDKLKPPLRTRVASRLMYPAAAGPETIAAVHELARAAIVSLGITDGPAHVELIVTGDGPSLVELGARGGGGHVFSTIVEAVSGVQMVRESARVLVGDPAQLTVRHARGCVYELFVPRSGVIREIRGVEQARALPGVLALGITRKRGEVLGELTDSLQRSGFAVTTGRDREEAIRRADAVANTIEFVLAPVEVAHA